MQALSVSPIQGDCWGIPHFGNSYHSRPNWELCKLFVFSSSNSREFRFRRHVKFDLQDESVSNLIYRRKRLFAVPSLVTLALEQEVGGNELSNELGSNFSEVDCIASEEGKDIGEIVSNADGNRRKEVEVGGETGMRIDVRALAETLHDAKTADDVEEVLCSQDELPLPVYSSMIRGFGINKRMESAMALFQWLKRKKNTTNGRIGPNLFIYNSLLGAMKQCKEFGELDKIMEEMSEEGVVSNIVTCNTLMAIHLERDEPRKSIAFLEEIRKRGLSLSPISYSTALLAYRKMEDGSGALNFYVDLRDRHQKGELGDVDDGEDWDNELVKLENFIIRICYQVMRRWLVKGEKMSTNVLKLLGEMDKAGLKPGRVEHEKLIWACTLEGHYFVAKELYSRIREMDTEISLSVCNHVIWVMGKAKKWWTALEIYEDLLDKGPKPNNLSYELVVSHFNVLLTAASRRGIWRWGVRLINKMEEKGLKPRSREWNSVLVACSKASETSAAVQIFRRMVEQGEKPTILSYGALLSALEKGKLYDEALQVWEHMVKLGFKPNLYAYTILASIHVGQGNFEKVESVIAEMIDSGVQPTVVTYNAIISGCANNGLGSTAFEWFHRMKEKNLLPNEITFEMLILGLARDAKPIVAYEMYLKAQNEDGLRLSAKAYDAVVCSAKTFGATIDVSSLGPRPPERKKKVKPRKSLSEFCDLADVPRRSKPFEKEELYTEGSQ